MIAVMWSSLDGPPVSGGNVLCGGGRGGDDRLVHDAFAQVAGDEGGILPLEEGVGGVDLAESSADSRRTVGEDRQTVLGDRSETAVHRSRALEECLEGTGGRHEILMTVAPSSPAPDHAGRFQETGGSADRTATGVQLGGEVGCGLL